jgi:hypothetical protein
MLEQRFVNIPTLALARCQTSFMISSSCGMSVVCLGLVVSLLEY